MGLFDQLTSGNNGSGGGLFQQLADEQKKQTVRDIFNRGDHPELKTYDEPPPVPAAPESAAVAPESAATAPERGFLGKTADVLKSIDRGFTAFKDAGANALTLGLYNKLLEHNNQQDRIANEDSGAGTAGSIAGSLLPIGGAYKLAGSIPKLLPQAGKVVGSLARGATAGAAYGAATEGLDAAIDTRNDGSQSLAKRAANAGVDAALFGAGDAALTGLGALSERLGLTAKVKEALSNLFSRGKNEADGTVQELLALPAPKPKMLREATAPSGEPIPMPGRVEEVKPLALPEGKLTPQTRLKVETNPDVYLNRVLERIKPIVTERMTPPLENPNELAKWVQGHLGEPNISLNEVRKLPYEDLRQLAEEIRPRLSVADVATQVAKEHGYDLPALLERKIPTVRGQQALDAQKAVYGVPIRRVNIKPPAGFNRSVTGQAAISQRLKLEPQGRTESLTPVPPADPPRLQRTGGQSAEPAFVASTPPPTSSPRLQRTASAGDAALVSHYRQASEAYDNTLTRLRDQYGQDPRQWPDQEKAGLSKLNKIKSGLEKEVAAKGLTSYGDTQDYPFENVAQGRLTRTATAPKSEGAKPENVPTKEEKYNDPFIERGGAENWKDKSKLSLIRETMERNFEDIMGKDAPAMIKKYLTPIKKNEAERQRFIKQEKGDIRALGIKYKSDEDRLIQQYGEGLITLDELKAQTPNWQKVVDAVKEFREKYDHYLKLANTALERNGYAPIPRRENYFPHYQEVDDLLSHIGIKLQNAELPTDINGLTADFRPGKNFFAHAMERKGNQTTFGVLEGFDRYIEGISRLIHHTDDIQRLRGLDKDIRKKYEGTTHLSNFVAELTDYTNNLAGKKAAVDRAAESIVGRKIYKAVDALRSRVGANMVGANIGSALTNFIPLTQAMATTEKKAFLQGMLGTIQNVFQRDSFAQASTFLSAREGADPLAVGLWGKAIDSAGWLFKIVDRFTSQTIVRGKYLEGIEKGLSPEAAMQRADDWASRVIGDRSLGSQPTLFNSRTLGLLTQFQLEVNNQLSFMFKDIPRNFSKAGTASAIGQLFLYSYLFNNLYEKVIGRRPAFDPIGMAVDAVKDFNNPMISNSKALKNLGGNAINNLPFSSLFYGGRIPIGAALPDIPGLIKGEAKTGEELLKPVIYLLPPVGGGQLNKTREGLSRLGLSPFASNKPGDYETNQQGEEYIKYPIERSPANVIRGTLFGPGAFPETQQYYRLDRRALSPAQTRSLEKSSNPKATYGKLMLDRRKASLQHEYDDMRKRKDLTPTQKAEKKAELEKRYRGLQKLSDRGG